MPQRGETMATNTKKLPLVASTARTTNSASIGKGGADYGTAASDMKKQLVQNRVNETNNSGYRQSETQRALQVIQQRQAAGLDTSAQEKYLTKNLGYTAPAQATQTPRATASVQPINRTSENTQQGSELMSLMRQMATRQSQPFSYDVNSDPEYQAALKRAQSNIQEGQNATMAEMNRRGILNSTITSDRSGEIAANEMGRVETEVVPALVNQAYQRYQGEQAQQQQQMANIAMLAQMYQGEDQRGFGNRVTEAGLTGNWMPEGAQGIVDNIVSLKQQAEAQGVTAQQRAQLSAQADAYRAQLLSLGVDPAAYGANVNAASAAANPGVRTLAGQQQDLAAQQQAFNQQLQSANFNEGIRQYDQNFAYQTARDAITDQQWKAMFDRDVQQFGLNYGLNMLQERNQQAFRQVQMAMSQDENARAWLSYENELNGANTQRYSGATANQVYDAIRQQFIDPDTKKIPSDAGTKTQIYERVMSMGLPDGQDSQVMSMLGLSSSDIQKFDKQYGVSSGN